MNCPKCGKKLCQGMRGISGPSGKINDYPIMHICVACESMFVEFELNLYEILKDCVFLKNSVGGGFYSAGRI